MELNFNVGRGGGLMILASLLHWMDGLTPVRAEPWAVEEAKLEEDLKKFPDGDRSCRLESARFAVRSGMRKDMVVALFPEFRAELDPSGVDKVADGKKFAGFLKLHAGSSNPRSPAVLAAAFIYAPHAQRPSGRFAPSLSIKSFASAARLKKIACLQERELKDSLDQFLKTANS